MFKQLLKSISFLIIFLIPFTVKATDSDLSDKTIIIGYEPMYGIIDDINSLNNVGYGYELLLEMQEYTDYTFEFKAFTFDDGLTALENDEIDVFGPISYTKERDAIFSYTTLEFLREQIILAQPNVDEIIYYNDPQSLNKKSVSIYEDVIINDYLYDYARQNNIEFSYLPSVDPDEYYHRADADLFLVTSLNTFLQYRTVLNLGTSDLFLVTRDDNLSKELDYALEQVFTHNPSLLSELYLKYYDSSGLTNRSLSKTESDALKQKTLVVGYSSTQYPLQYSDENGNPAGIIVDVLNHLSEFYDFSIKYVPTAENLLNYNYDILLSSTTNRNYEALDEISSLPLMLIRYEDDTSPPVNLGYIDNSSLEFSRIESEYPNSNLVAYENIDALLKAFEQGHVDGLLVSNIESYYILDKYSSLDLSLQATNLSLPLRFFISKSLPYDVSNAFNTIIHNLNHQVIENIMANISTSYLNNYTIGNIINDYRSEVVISILIAFMIFFLFLIILQWRKKQEILYIGNHDDITGLISIQYFRERAARILKDSSPNELEIITLDIDYFRLINTTFGYERGTAIIKSIANVLKNSFGKNTAIVSRVTGDQFVILRKSKVGTPISHVCEKPIHEAVKSIIGKSYNLTLSVGIHVIDDMRQPINVLIDRANAARVLGKSLHKNTYTLFDDAMKQKLDIKNEIVFSMEPALKNKEFYAVYQPKVNLKTFEIEGAEALVRWKTSDGKTIFPNDFIPIFEANGFATELDLYVFEEVCSFIKNNRDSTNVPVISVNLSGKSVDEPDILEKLIQILNKYDLEPSCVELEVTESALIDESRAFTTRISDMREYGFTVSMDDFGTGASSLNRLHSIDVDVVKLDRVFLESNISNSKGNLIVQSVIELVQKLDMKVVSEGVETKAQTLWLKNLNCDIAQGYYFYKPLEEKDFLYALQNKKTDF